MKMVMIMSIFHGLSIDPLLNMGHLAVLLKPCFRKESMNKLYRLKIPIRRLKNTIQNSVQYRALAVGLKDIFSSTAAFSQFQAAFNLEHDHL